MLAEHLAVEPIRSDAVAPWRAARVAFGVVVPLAIGSASDYLDYGAFAALGALPAGFAVCLGPRLSVATRQCGADKAAVAGL